MARTLHGSCTPVHPPERNELLKVAAARSTPTSVAKRNNFRGRQSERASQLQRSSTGKMGVHGWEKKTALLLIAMIVLFFGSGSHKT